MATRLKCVDLGERWGVGGVVSLLPYFIGERVNGDTKEKLPNCYMEKRNYYGYSYASRGVKVALPP